MANIALQSAATGLAALNTKLDVIANNLANVNTTGFKASRANFQDLMYIERAAPGVENAIGDRRPTGLLVGLGVEVSGTQNDFSQGTALTTNRDYDLRIEGIGFFKVRVEDSTGGGVAYTRAGNFSLNADGELVLANDQGRRLDPVIAIPNDATSVTISTDGRVQVLQPGQTQYQDVGQIQLTAFVNPAGLKQIGENLWVETPASGPPLEGTPGTDNRGRLIQGQLESSNVDPTFELIEMIRTQRSFEMNSNTIRAADATLQAIAQLRR
ncbi:MAG: flagellar basal-body rod protein FlgG [Phycisphaeraceae bacterium]|jgi:flagellar basal-body rod protein FlgG|nr:flagellar basal-body rod protein FlgG [Phycisphaeraceae bacterium]